MFTTIKKLLQGPISPETRTRIHSLIKDTSPDTYLALVWYAAAKEEIDIARQLLTEYDRYRNEQEKPRTELLWLPPIEFSSSARRTCLAYLWSQQLLSETEKTYADITLNGYSEDRLSVPGLNKKILLIIARTYGDDALIQALGRSDKECLLQPINEGCWERLTPLHLAALIWTHRFRQLPRL